MVSFIKVKEFKITSFRPHKAKLKIVAIQFQSQENAVCKCSQNHLTSQVNNAKKAFQISFKKFNAVEKIVLIISQAVEITVFIFSKVTKNASFNQSVNGDKKSFILLKVSIVTSLIVHKIGQTKSEIFWKTSTT